ncbi:MAG: response regulator [Alphaproteobacteria bacterium]
MARILIIDDEGAIVGLFSAALNRDDHTVFGAPSYEAARLVIEREPIDLVITDLHMPGIDGYDVIRSFRRDFPQTLLMAMTGSGGGPELEKALGLGADAVLPKPFRLKDILTTVARCLSAGRCAARE